MVVFTLLRVGRVGEVHPPLFLQHARRHRGVDEVLVEEELLHGQGLPPVQAADHHATVAVVLVLVPHVHQDAAVAQLHGLGGGGNVTRMRVDLCATSVDHGMMRSG